MKKKITLALLAGAAVLSASAQSKFDATSRLIMSQYEIVQANPDAALPQLALVPFDAKAYSRADSRAAIFVNLLPGYSAADVEARGFDILVDLEDLVVAEGTFDAIKTLEQCDFVKNISFSQERKPMLDKARNAIGLDDIHAGNEGLPKAYTGKGVIAGLYDLGVDPNHANFCNEDGTTRIKTLWHHTYVESGGGKSKFTTYDTDEKIKAFTTDSRSDTHGTHTLGCMVGSFKGEGGGTVTYIDETGRARKSTKMANPYYGAATGADLAVGCGSLRDANIIAAVKNMVDYAKMMGKPLVVNLSIGQTIGTHDETDYVNEALDKLGKDAIICVSAGNEGQTTLSFDKTFTSSDKSLQSFFTTTNGSSYPGIVDIWTDSSKGVKVTAFIYDYTNKKIVREYVVEPTTETNELWISTSDISQPEFKHDNDFDAAFSNSSHFAITSGVNSKNNRYNCNFNFNLSYNPYKNKLNKGQRNYIMGFKIEGEPGVRAMVNAISTTNGSFTLTSLGIDGFKDGNGDFSASAMACGKKVISVGSWNSRSEWPFQKSATNTSTDSYGKTEGEVSDFTSYGKLADGRIVPFICGPGSAIVSSISLHYVEQELSGSNYGHTAVQKFNGRNNHWQAQQGTSMSSPVVAGSICLWLEADPTLTVEDVQDIIKNHANSQGPAAANPIQWGYGKFEALKGLKYVINSGSVTDITIEDDKYILTPRGENNWEVFVPGASEVLVSVYSTSGQLVKTVAAEGNEITFATDDLAKGIYIANINGSMSTRIVVR